MVNLIKLIFQTKKILSLKIEKGEDIFDRGYNLKKVEVDSTFPEYIFKNKDKLKEWIV